MTEHEVLELLSSYSAQQQGLLAQIISLHLVMVAAIYYFLHRSGVLMKLGVLALYTLGYATHAGLLYNVSTNVVAARAQLDLISQAYASVSPITQNILSREGWTDWSAIVANVCLATLWFGTVGFLFFWKRPAER